MAIYIFATLLPPMGKIYNGSFSIWYSRKYKEAKKAQRILDAMSDEEFYNTYKPLENKITNKKVLNRLINIERRGRIK